LNEFVAKKLAAIKGPRVVTTKVFSAVNTFSSHQ